MRLIDADALLAAYDAEHKGKPGRARELIVKAPTVEPKRGRWVKDDDNWDVQYECSVCGEAWVMNDGTPADNNMNYCPNCGAKMEGDAE